MPIGESILKACKLRGVSLARACALADLRYSTLHSQIHNKREIPFSTIDKLAVALHLPIGYFSDHAPSLRIEPDEAASALQANAARALSDRLTRQKAAIDDWGYQIGTDDVIDWLIANDSRLVKHEWLIEQVDLFHMVKRNDPMPRPYRIGARSLAKRYFRLFGTEDYADVVGNFEPVFVDRLIEDHLKAARQQYTVTDIAFDQVIDGSRVRGSYRRLMAPVTATDGQRLMLLFSKLTQLPG